MSSGPTILAPLLATMAIGCGLTGGPLRAENWTYEGTKGPEFWGDLDPAFARCRRGNQQSPVNLAPARRAELETMKFDWRAGPARVVNTGRMLRVELFGNVTQLGDSSYRLLQFHLHKPAEHQIGGRRFPLEIHFVHVGNDGDLFVVAVMVEEGRANAALQKVLIHAPVDAGARALDMTLAPASLLPRTQNRFRYEGSLSIPPCSETVSWIVYATPVQASAEQIARFGQFFEGNARPVQPLNRRFILKDF